MTPMPLLRTENLVVGYGELRIVQGVSIELREGEIVSLLGPNGSGKSTLIKGIMGLARVFEGRVLLDGADVTGVPTYKLVRTGVGYVPQRLNIFSNLTVKENLEIGGCWLKKGRVKSRIEEVLTYFPELKPKLEVKAGLLSGGERQLLALARALIPKPKLLLLDEPTASLSPIAADRVLSCVKEVASQGVPILMAEQNAVKALKSSDRSYILLSGRCVAESSSSKALSDEKLKKLYLGLEPLG